MSKGTDNVFENDTESFDATIMNFIILGESVSKLSTEFKKRYHEIDWYEIYTFRNVITHDYFGILTEEVWQIIKNNLAKNKTRLDHILKD